MYIHVYLWALNRNVGIQRYLQKKRPADLDLHCFKTGYLLVLIVRIIILEIMSSAQSDTFVVIHN